jgi:uncharacterized ubiquitin-like protein YukD
MTSTSTHYNNDAYDMKVSRVETARKCRIITIFWRSHESENSEGMLTQPEQQWRLVSGYRFRLPAGLEARWTPRCSTTPSASPSSIAKTRGTSCCHPHTKCTHSSSWRVTSFIWPRSTGWRVSQRHRTCYVSCQHRWNAWVTIDGALNWRIDLLATYTTRYYTL